MIPYPIPADALRGGLVSIEIVVEKTNPQVARLPVVTFQGVEIDDRGGLEAGFDRSPPSDARS